MNAIQPISKNQLLEALNWRYATKKFDKNKRIAPDLWATLEQALVLSPSSFGLQPWKFIVVTSASTKAELSAAAYGQTQPADASHFVVFAVRKNLGMDYVDKFLGRTAEVRGIPVESLAGYRQVMQSSIEGSAKAGTLDGGQAQQCFVALGQFMTAAALLGVDTCALGGIDRAKFDEILGLDNIGYTTAVTCAAGYRAADDKYAALPKVRFENKDVLAYA